MVEKRSCPYCLKGSLKDSVNGRICASCGKWVKDDACPLPPGTLLDGGRFQVIRVMGSGGFGVTYQAWDRKGQRYTAVKELFPSSCVTRGADSPEVRVSVEQEKQEYFQYALNNFVKEAKTIYRFREYPEIPKLYRWFRQYGTAYYAMEFLDGRDLAGYLKRQGKVSWRQIEGPVRDVLQCLYILHKHDLIHRDISPDNIILLKNGHAKLIDFGSARDYVSAEHFTTIIKESFAPPELFRKNSEQGPPTDIFLLCGTIYYVLSGGRLPEKSYNRYDSITNAHKDSLVPLSSYGADAPGYVTKAVEQGLNLKREQRFDSVEALAHALYPNQSVRFADSAPAQNTGSVFHVACSRGCYQGKIFPLPTQKVVSLGQGAKNDIAFPEGTPGVSHTHCSLYVDQYQNIYIRDDKSRYGTIVNGQRLRAGEWYVLKKRQGVRIGNEEFEII